MFWKNYFWGRNEWGLYVIGLYRKCHKSDQEAQVDWPVGALRRVGKIVRIIQAHSGDKLGKEFLVRIVCVCACVYACFVSVLCMFHCIELLILNLSRMKKKKTPYWMQQILASHVN